MTSASELFYQRRFRLGRNSDHLVVGSGLESPPPPSRTNRRHRHYNIPATTGGNHPRRSRRDPDGCYPLRHAVHNPRQNPPHRSSHPPQTQQERDSIQLEEAGHQFSPGSNSRSETQVDVQDRLRLSGNNDRLPGAVLLARERLLQRLRGVTLSSSSRQSNRSSSGTLGNDIAMGDDFLLVDTREWETEISRMWISTIAPVTNPADQYPSKRPPGLTQEALSRLQVEVFCVAEESKERNTSRASRECSICLESFSEGDKLIHLPCKHRYHFRCLDPWVRTCGDCPYCRGGVDVNLEGVKL